jgi:hypothetical protein
MQTIAQLEENNEIRPNSIEVSEALANEYVKQQRWEDAVRTYQSLLSLYPATASLFVNRIRLGAIALAISSVLVLAKGLIQPVLSDVTLRPNAFAQELSSTSYLVAQSLVLLAFPLFSTAAISIYKLLSYTHDHRPAFWAMVFSVIGVGLSMPSLGVSAIVLPLIGRLYLAGELDTFNIYSAMEAMPWSLILNLGSYIFVLGIAIFCWVILRNKNFPKLPAILFLAGWVAFLAFADNASKLKMIFTGSLILIGGIGLAISVWTQAPLQFKPITAPTQKADS